MSEKSYPEIVKHLSGVMMDLNKGIPGPWKGFVQLADQAKAPSALDAKMKELIAVAISISMRCDGCIGFHVRGAVKNGATRQEMMDTIAVAVMMNGGPGTVYGAYALEAYDQFANKS
ncbi:MAG: carboxymuconolactone decarboxylase family protein [Rhodospirillales bacterium]|nr:carboxymuconolactone decarboxylase family protein [Rhodospirillales bacterium]